jgi:hypothetical protein
MKSDKPLSIELSVGEFDVLLRDILLALKVWFNWLESIERKNKRRASKFSFYKRLFGKW